MMIVWTSVVCVLIAATLHVGYALNNPVHCGRGYNISVNASKLTTDGQRLRDDCLYYSFVDKQKQLTGREQDVYDQPPYVDGSVVIKFIRSDIATIYDNDGDLKDMNVEGQLWLQWSDARLKWDLGEWKGDTLKLDAGHQIWTPRISTPLMEGSFPVDSVMVRNDGECTASIEYTVRPQCSIDYSRFPKDNHRCCVDFESIETQVRFEISESIRETTFTDASIQYISDVWKPSTFRTILFPGSDFFEDRVSACFTVARKSNTLKIELVLPVVVCMSLVVMSPLFGDLRTQVYVKMFALLVQLMSMQAAGQRVPAHAFYGTTPAIYRFYEFSILLTICSFGITLMFMASARQQRKWPPPHNLVTTSRTFNRTVCCHIIPADAVSRAMQYTVQYNTLHNGPDTSDASATVNATEPTASQPLDFSNEWLEIFVACNNWASLCIVSIYMIVSIIILY